MKKVTHKTNAFPKAFVRPAHDPEWDEIFNKDPYDSVQDDLFDSRLSNQEVKH